MCRAPSTARPPSCTRWIRKALESRSSTPHHLGAALSCSASFARVGGDEFALALPASKAHEGIALAERVRSAVHALAIPLSHAEVATADIVSVSQAVFTAPPDCSAGLLEHLRDQVYAAKRQGRGSVYVSDPVG